LAVNLCCNNAVFIGCNTAVFIGCNNAVFALYYRCVCAVKTLYLGCCILAVKTLYLVFRYLLGVNSIAARATADFALKKCT